MKEIKVKWTGIRPMIMHNAAMIDPENPHVIRKAELLKDKKKAKKGDTIEEGRIRKEMEEQDWLGSVYWDDQSGGFFLPGLNIMACIVEGARKRKNGSRAQSGIVPIDDVVPIKNGKAFPKTSIAAYESGEFTLRQAVRIPPRTGSRVMSVRPMIPTGWWVVFTVEFDETIIPKEDLLDAMKDGGSLVGVGDWRPRFGRFIVEEVK